MADIAALRGELGLSGSLPAQYFDWLGEILQRSLGTSLRSRQPILGELVARIPGILILVGISLVLMDAIAVPCGIIGALYAGRPADHLSRVIGLIGESPPSFFRGVLLAYVSAAWLKWLPSMGRGGGPRTALSNASMCGWALHTGWYPVALTVSARAAA